MQKIHKKLRELINEISELDKYIALYGKERINNVVGEGYEVGAYVDNINLDIAKSNYEKYKEKTKLKRDNYIKTLYYLINRDSTNGKLFVDTLNIRDSDFITYDFLVELGDYFKEKGFKCELFGGHNSGYLRISGWQ